MKKIILIAGIVMCAFLFSIGDEIEIQNSCAFGNCPPKQCRFDLSCGNFCFCYKGRDEYIYGRCVPE